MAERDRFELDLAEALRTYALDAPIEVRPTELARSFATAHPRRRSVLGPWRLPLAPGLAWLLLLAALLTAMLAGMLAVGSQLPRGLPAVVAPIASPASASAVADGDEALVAALAAVVSEPYDAARVAALYSPHAVFHEVTADLTHAGLDAIGARIRSFNEQRFRAVATSAPIRQDDFVAVFSRYGTRGDLSSRALVVYELKDGKVLNQWVYPAP